MMKKNLILIFLLLFFAFKILAQVDNPNCNQATQSTYLHGNEVRATIRNSGDLFQGLDKGSFQVPFNGINTPNSIFSAAIWLVGKDSTGKFRSAIQTYRTNFSNEYWAGPLDVNAQTTQINCKAWDKIWSITANDVARHQADFADNSRIDKPQQNIFSYPAKGNTFFQQYNGFALPDGDLAPFYDSNKDGEYTPQLGDFPLPSSVDVSRIPAQMTWCVFNDKGGIHTNVRGTPIGAEVQLTTWAFETDTTNYNLLNRTIFTSHKVINKSNVKLDSFYIGLWTDFDLGCFADDYIGSCPENNTYFVYNRDSIDGIYNGGSLCLGTYGSEVPVQTVTYLNRPLSSLKYYYNAGECNPLPATTDPNALQEFYYIMQGKWKDGTPLTRGGSGYKSGGEVTQFAFPDDPTDPNGWSMATVNNPCGDRRVVSSNFVGNLAPKASISLDAAWASHQYPNLSPAQSASKARKDVSIFKAAYDTQFKNIVPATNICIGSECVYPGDLNHDSIADNRDLLAWGYAYGNKGEIRKGTLNWQPKTATEWTQKLSNSLNFKHIDGNGNGIIDSNDLDLTKAFLNNTIEPYSPIAKEKEGNNLVVSSMDVSNFESINKTVFSLEIGLKDTNNIIGYAFSVRVEEKIPTINAFYRNFKNTETSFVNTRISNVKDSLFYFAVVNRERKNISNGSGLRLFITGFDKITDLRFLNVVAMKTDGSIIELGQSKIKLQRAGFVNIEEADNAIIKVYPNPFDNHIQVSFPNKTARDIHVIDALGRVILSKNGNYTEGVDLSLDNITNGLYLLKLTIDNQVFVKRIVKN
jgi:Secretion system C-terminal sorting domain